MKNIKLLNKIAKVGLDVYDKNEYNCAEDIENPDAIMVRSAAMHDMEFGKELLAIARAGAGVNNIPVTRCADEGIVVFNTPGANANGVKELAIAALLLASRDISAGINWANTLDGHELGVVKAVEKGKSAFAGSEIQGKTLGVIGLGAIGAMVANVAVHLGMKVVGCDPYISVDSAWRLSSHVVKANSYDDVYAVADYITIHVPATDETKGMLNSEAFGKMKDGVKLINLSRADLVHPADLKAAVQSGKISRYVTDFPTEELINVDHVICTPHLGASTEESEDNCAVMAANELIDYIENGNIVNSVNFPNAVLPREGDARICILHKNIPSMITQISGVLATLGINIENLINRSRKDYAYTMIEIIGDMPESVEKTIKAIDGVIRVRIIK